MVEGTDCLGVAAAPAYRKPWIAFARQKFTRSGFDDPQPRSLVSTS